MGSRNRDTQVINKIRSQLSKELNYSSSRNYQTGSVFVERRNKIIGLCLDGEPASILQNLDISSEDFPHLQDLVVRSTSLRSLPNWVHEFNHVENLILKGLNLRRIETDLSEFKNLTFLALPNNKLSDLVDQDLRNLVRLNLNRNKFERIPEVVTKIPQLISLMMDNNFLTSTPSKFTSNRIQAVSMENNQLTTIPPFLQDQTLLYTLDLSRNFISDIPTWLGDFAELQYLNLGWNQIEGLPKSMSQLNKLKLLELQYNPNLDLDTSIIYGLSKLDIINIEHSGESKEMIDKIRAYQKLFDLNFVIKY